MIITIKLLIMKKSLLLFLCSLFLILYSCSDNEENVTNNVPINVQLIGKGNIMGDYLTQQNTIITNSTQWNNLLNDLNSANNVSDGFTETNIDFNQYMVIAVIDEIYPNGGHSIDIITATEMQQNIVIDVEKLLAGNVTTVVTQPYHIVKIPKSTKPVLFQ